MDEQERFVSKHPRPPQEGGNPMQPAAQPGGEVDEWGRRMCGARTREGGSCRAPAMDGQARCRLHGGASPQAKRKARLKLIELVDPAIATIARVMVNGAKDADKLRAAEAILDRAGHPRSSRIEGRVSLEESRDVLLQQLLAVRAGQRSELAAPAPLEVVEAEIVDDDDR